MKGTVTEVKPSSSGKSYVVKIGGASYCAKLDSKLDGAVGKAIDFLVEPSDYKGATINWIKSWDYDRQATPLPTPSPEAPSGPSIKPTGASDRWWLPFTSNMCAHFIAAGVIKGAVDLRSYALAARRAIEAADRDTDEPNF
jgi:hypothetical protein